MKRALARRLRFLADRIDPHGAPRYTGMSFAIETGRGFVVHEDEHGCPIVYLGSDDYERAFDRPADRPSRRLTKGGYMAADVTVAEMGPVPDVLTRPGIGQ